MQTFLPYPDFNQSAQCLDNKRLGKQRVECLQILQCLKGEKDGWKNHPAVTMWWTYENHLVDYGLAICDEWINRGYKDSCRSKILKYQKLAPNGFKGMYVHWLGDEKFHLSHKSNLIRKKPDFYKPIFGNDIPDNLPYFWPTKELCLK